MKKSILFPLLIVFGISIGFISCKKKDQKYTDLTINIKPSFDTKAYYLNSFDSTLIGSFFNKHPNLKKYEQEVTQLYRKRNYEYIWYDKKGILEVGHQLYNKIKNIEDEGIKTTIPYKDKLEAIFKNSTVISEPKVEDELYMSCLYFLYTNKVLKGLDENKSAELGWYIPREKKSYVNYLDSIIANPTLIEKNEKEVFGQYYRLKEMLQKYKNIAKSNPWNPIVPDSSFVSFKPGDSSQTIAQIRHRLFVLGDITTDSENKIYDDSLSNGILRYKSRMGNLKKNTITKSTIESLNVPIVERIKTIIVNMERCRWISTNISKANELIIINIPSYQLTYFKNGKPVLFSKVVVGKEMNKTVIFSADMKYIVFSPYWNVPRSIIEKEIAPAMAKNPKYLAQHNMEWNKGNIRQKPGPKNSLGLVKFLFPNNNSIYLHDTPSKNLFNEEKRAFSHGCIRIEKPRELANLILKDDKNWTPEKIDAAMNKGKESWYALQNKIPVYIGYFTAWVDHEGVLHFYNDVYQRDERLATMLFEE